MARKRADSGRDREIAAAYSSGLSLVACAVKFGTGRTAVRGALVRTGTPFRGKGRYVRPYPWEAEAAARRLAGESQAALAREYGVEATVMHRVVERQVTPGPRGRASGRGKPPGGAS